jgi:hypothetical protein
LNLLELNYYNIVNGKLFEENIDLLDLDLGQDLDVFNFTS